MWRPVCVPYKIVTDNFFPGFVYLCTNVRWAAGLCFKNPLFRISPKEWELIQKLELAIYSTEALLYWQKAADTMLWKKAYAVMDDG